jgi:hypothetical protein
MKEVGLSTFLWSTPRENVKNLTKHAIIDLIRFTPNGISRVELSRQLNLSRAAITAALPGRRSPAIGVVVQALSLVYHSNVENGDERR